MEMKLLKVKISSDLLFKMGHPLIFEYISLVEIQNILQHDLTNIFIQAKITARDNLKKKYNLIRAYDTIHFLHVLMERGNQFTCLMHIKTKEPFWPDLGNIPYAIIPPVVLDPDSSHFSLIISEKTIKKLNKFISRYTESYEILALEKMGKDIKDDVMLSPKFTERQNEIARYAYRNGYFSSPKGISAEEIAKEFNISTSAITKHMRIATEKAMGFFFS